MSLHIYFPKIFCWSTDVMWDNKSENICCRFISTYICLLWKNLKSTCVSIPGFLDIGLCSRAPPSSLQHLQSDIRHTCAGGWPGHSGIAAWSHWCMVHRGESHTVGGTEATWWARAWFWHFPYHASNPKRHASVAPRAICLWWAQPFSTSPHPGPHRLLATAAENLIASKHLGACGFGACLGLAL